MTEPRVLEIESHGAVRVLRLNRPERKNALSSELGWAIVQAVEAAASDDTVRVVGVTGAGDAFCSGVDLAPQGDEGGMSPLSAHDARVDDLGWVGRFLDHCGALAELSPMAARQTKRLVSRVGLPPDLESHLRDELTWARRGLASDDSKEAVRAIMEKRKPVFRGR